MQNKSKGGIVHDASLTKIGRPEFDSAPTGETSGSRKDIGSVGSGDLEFFGMVLVFVKNL